MAEGKNIVINAVLVALSEAEDRLLAQDLEKNNVKNALKELKVLIEPVARSSDSPFVLCWSIFSNASANGMSMV